MADTATIATARSLTVSAATPATSAHKMTITSEDQSMRVTVRYAPKAVTYANVTRNWAQVQRPGRAPILSSADMPLPTLSYDLILAHPSPNVTQDTQWSWLVRMARAEDRVTIVLGASESGFWHITNLSMTTVERHPDTQKITQATVTMELTRASDATARVGPVSGGHSKTSKKPTYYGGVTYRVRKGDTLGRISNRFYKTPRRWRLVADANKIRRPKQTTKLKVGRKIRIPKVKR